MGTKKMAWTKCDSYSTKEEMMFIKNKSFRRGREEEGNRWFHTTYVDQSDLKSPNNFSSNTPSSFYLH